MTKASNNLRVMECWKHVQLRSEKAISAFIAEAGPRGEDEGKTLPDRWNDTGGGYYDEFDEDSASSDSCEILKAPSPPAK